MLYQNGKILHCISRYLANSALYLQVLYGLCSNINKNIIKIFLYFFLSVPCTQPSPRHSSWMAHLTSVDLLNSCMNILPGIILGQFFSFTLYIDDETSPSPTTQQQFPMTRPCHLPSAKMSSRSNGLNID